MPRLASFFSLLLLSLICSIVEGQTIDDAHALYKAKKWERARNVYQRLLPQLPTNRQPEVLNKIGYCYEREFNYKLAISQYQRVIDQKEIPGPVLGFAYLRMGYCQRMNKQPREGIKSLLQVPQIKDSSPDQQAEAFLYAGWGHGTLDEDDETIRLLSQIENIPKVHTNYTATAWLTIGQIYQKRGDYRQAISIYKKIDQLKVVAFTNRARANVNILACEALLEGDTTFLIKPYVSKVTTSSAKIFWVSQGDAPMGKVYVNELNQTKPIEPESKRLSGTICQLHVAELTKLNPHTRYHFRVVGENASESGSFRTAPEKSVPVRFGIIGDTQSYAANLQPLLDSLGDEKPDFTLHVGDLVDRGNLWGEWRASFFGPGRAYMKESIIWPAYGNHDGGPYFGPLFDLVPHYYHSFDWGNAHFIVLDSYGPGTGGVGRKQQLEWLKKDLEQNDKQWTFVTLHIPMITTRSSLKRFGEEDILPLLEKHNVDIVFSGHHPHYRRYRPIARGTGKSIIHITSGGGGGPVGGNTPSPLLARGIDVNHYCIVDLRGNKLSLTAKSITGLVIDQFELVKNHSGRFQDKVEQLTVSNQRSKQIASFYMELLTDRTFQMQLTVNRPVDAGKPANLILDFEKLPRGAFDPNSLPDGSVLIIESTDKSHWKIKKQEIPITSSKLTIRAIVPEDISINRGVIKPAAEISFRLKTGNQLFEPATATARIQTQPEKP